MPPPSDPARGPAAASPCPAVPSAPPVPPVPPEGPFTELDARRLGRVRRYFVLHPRVMDWIVALWFGLPALLMALLGVAEHRAFLALSAVAGTAVLLRRRDDPVLVAAGVTLLGVVTIVVTRDTNGYELAVALAVYAVAASRPPHVAWTTAGGAVLALGTAALLLYDVRIDGDGLVSRHGDAPGTVTADRVATTAVLLAGVLVALAIGAGVRARRQHVADLLGRANGLARDRDQQARLAVADERARIAREMHDVVAHSLTVMIALADGAKASGAKNPELAGHALDELTETGRAALADMRRVLGVLRDPDEAGAPLAPDDVPPLEDVVERFRAAGLPVRLVRTGPQPTLSPTQRSTVHRIVQESLTNVLRYAPVTPLVVVEVSRRDDTASRQGDWLDVRVVNQAGRAPGAGAVPPAARTLLEIAAQDGTVGTGRGIIGMRERAAVFGGTVTAGPSGTGWAVHATIRLDGGSTSGTGGRT